MNQWCQLGAATVRDGSVFVRCKGPAVDEDGTAPDYGDVPFMCALGLSAVPYPPTETGYAEALVSRDAPGLDGVATNGRDTRTAAAIGNPKPGTTVLHSTGPQQAAQVQCIEDTRRVAMLTKNSSKKTMMVLLDGAGDGKYQVTVGGALIQIDGASGDISLVNKSGKGLLIQGSAVHVIGMMTAESGAIAGDQNGAGFAARSDYLLTYLGALETLLSSIAGATVPPTTAAVTSFVAAMSSVKAAIAATSTKVA